MDAVRYYSITLLMGIAVIGLWLGGGWVWLGIGTFPVLMALDILLPPDHRARNVRSPAARAAATAPMYLHVPLLLVLWALFLVRVGQWGSGSSAVSSVDVIGMVLSVGWVGAVPNVPVMHELMHRRHWFPRALAKVCSTFCLDPNRDIGHRLTHHIELCTPADSDTPTRGQTTYSFMWQASYGAWKDGVVTTLTALRKRDLSFFHRRNALYIEAGLLGLFGVATAWMAGLPGLLAAAVTSLFSKLLLEGLNYLQHYGLVRVPGAPVRLHHAWNHLGAVIRPVGLEITTHIEHHFDSRHQFFELKPRVDGAQMPSAFLCFAAALIPPLWERYIARPRLQHWDTHFASPAERVMAMEQNRKAGWPVWVEATAASSTSPSPHAA